MDYIKNSIFFPCNWKKCKSWN